RMFGHTVGHADVVPSGIGSVPDDYDVELRIDPALEDLTVPFGRLLLGLVPAHALKRCGLTFGGDHCIESALSRPIDDPVGIVLTPLDLVRGRQLLWQCRNAAVRGQE